MNNDELYHHGIKGMKWGVRRYQRPDGSYTPEGAKRYGHRTESTNAEIGKRQEEYRKSNAKMPVIVFNKDKVQVAKVREIGQREMAKALKDEQAKMLNKRIAKSVAGSGGATAAAVAGARALSNRSTQKQIREYKKKHPNTKMTDLEILDSITKAKYKG